MKDLMLILWFCIFVGAAVSSMSDRADAHRLASRVALFALVIALVIALGVSVWDRLFP